MKSYLGFFISAILLSLASAEIMQHRGELNSEGNAASSSKLVQRRLPYNCDFYGKKGGGGIKGGASCDIPSCCDCECYEEGGGGKKGRAGQVCDCVCDCGDDDDDDDDDPIPNTRPPTKPPTPAPVPPPVPFPPCNVCGNGRSVSLPGRTVRVEGFGMVECGTLEEDGLNRQISPFQCPLIPDQINNECGCNPPCNVCGNGRPIGNPNAVVEFAGEPAVRCEDLQAAGLAGSITPSECAIIPGFIRDICVCDPTSAPVIAPVAPPVCVPVGKKGGKGGKKGGNGCSPVAAPVVAPVVAPVTVPVAPPVCVPVGKKGGKGGKKGGDGCSPIAYSGKKGGYSGNYGGKKSGYAVEKIDYGGKKGGYSIVDPVSQPVTTPASDDYGGTTYGGKKGGYIGIGGYGGKKGGYGGKKEGYNFVAPVSQPVIPPESDDDDDDDDDDNDNDDDDDEEDNNDDDDDDDDDDGNYGGKGVNNRR